MTHVLIIEDDAWLADLEKMVLKKEGYDVRVASHALAAIAEVDALRPDVIVLDVLLAGSTAFALLHELQSYGDTGDIPIILCTNIAEQFNIEDLRHYGVKRIVNKADMVPGDIVAAVRAVL